jgi:hypothetical protein
VTLSWTLGDFVQAAAMTVAAIKKQVVSEVVFIFSAGHPVFVVAMVTRGQERLAACSWLIITAPHPIFFIKLFVLIDFCKY